MSMRAHGLSPPCGGPRTAERYIDGTAGTGVAIIKEMTEDPLRETTPSGGGEEDDLAEARRALEELEGAAGADALAPAGRLADLLEGLLEGREGEGS